MLKEKYTRLYLELEALAGAPLEEFQRFSGYRKKTIDGYMPLSVECVGAQQLSLAHWSEQNGDAMRDPEVVFLLDFRVKAAMPLEFRNDYAGIHQRFLDEEADVWAWGEMEDCVEFCEMWLKNLWAQGFFDEPGGEHGDTNRE